MGCKSPVFKPRYYQTIVAKVLAESKGESARVGLKDSERSGEHEPSARATAGSGNLEYKTMSRRTEMAYKAESPGKSAQHDEAPGLGDTVNGAVA